MVKLKEGTTSNPRLLNLNHYWKLISHNIHTDIFKEELKKQMENFINIRKNLYQHISSTVKYDYKTSLWKYSSQPIHFKKYRSDDINSINYYRIPRACHWISHVVLILIEALDPEQTWLIYNVEYHTAILNKNKTLVVDILAAPYGYKTGIDVLNAINNQK